MQNSAYLLIETTNFISIDQFILSISIYGKKYIKRSLIYNYRQIQMGSVFTSVFSFFSTNHEQQRQRSKKQEKDIRNFEKRSSSPQYTYRISQDKKRGYQDTFASLLNKVSKTSTDYETYKAPKYTSLKADKNLIVNEPLKVETYINLEQDYFSQIKQYPIIVHQSSTSKTDLQREDSLPIDYLRLTKDPDIINKRYELTNDDARLISKKGFKQGDQKFTVEKCRRQMEKQLCKLNTKYKYRFNFKQSPLIQVSRGKKMTRTIYLSFECIKCNKNRWTSIAGTFQVTFQYNRNKQQLLYHIQIYKTQCRNCLIYMEPQIYKTQMKAMKIFFSVIITNILDNKPPPEKPSKYYIRQNHWHKTELCEACKLGRCTTQN